MKNPRKLLLPFIVALGMMLSACGGKDTDSQSSSKETATEKETEKDSDSQDTENEKIQIEIAEPSFDISEIPSYTGNAYIVINENIPYFDDADMITDSFEMYSDLDELGRCGVAYANVGIDIMPTEKRGNIGKIQPTGWHTVKYDNIDGNYLYNRCHLIGYQLTAENANEKNLITGTRYLNVNGMLPFEDMVADYIKETNNHVLYRVSPIFEEDNLIATGVQMEAKSVEDDGEGILFNVFCYNVQPDIRIDYATGESSQVSLEAEDIVDASQISKSMAGEPASESVTETPASEQQPIVNERTYILNTNTKKFHSPTCRDIGKMKDENKQEYAGSREDIMNQGYEPCKHCNP